MEAQAALAAQRAADALAKRKERAWAASYVAPASCEHPPTWKDQVDCGNQYMRAKKEFEQRCRRSRPQRNTQAQAVNPRRLSSLPTLWSTTRNHRTMTR